MSQNKPGEGKTRTATGRNKNVSGIGGNESLCASRGVSEVTDNTEEMDIEQAGENESSCKLDKTTDLLNTLDTLKPLIEPVKRELQRLASADKNVGSKDNATIKRLEDRNRQLEKDNKVLKDDVDRLKRSEHDIQRSYDDQERKIKALETNLKSASSNFYKQKESYEKQCKADQERNDELNEMVKNMKRDLGLIADEKDGWQQQHTQAQNRADKLAEEKRKVDQELSECKSRLSRLMGSKLSDNNPDIADLSDKNRPTKLAEKYQELYDNEWTDAYEELENTGADDTRCIELLLELLKKVEDFCDELSKEQSTEIYKIVRMTQYKTTECPELSNEEKKQVKDFRKIFADVGVQEVQKRFTSDILKDSKFASIASKAKAKPFIKGCVELCWFMSVQDPPVVIGELPRSGVAFDTNHFKAYTKTGPKLHYVVWPPLFLHKGGPLLGKGVAQATGIPARVRRRQDVDTNASADAKPSTQPVPGIDPLYDNARTPGSQSDQVDVNSSAQSEQRLNTNTGNIKTSTFYMPRNTSESSNQQRLAKSMSQSRPGQTSVNNFDSRSGEPTHVDTKSEHANYPQPTWPIQPSDTDIYHFNSNMKYFGADRTCSFMGADKYYYCFWKVYGRPPW